MSDSPPSPPPTTTTLTPPIRSIAAEASSLIPTNDIDPDNSKMNPTNSKQKSREHSSSSSTFSLSTFSSDSLTSFSAHRNEDDDASSIDVTNEELTQLQERLHTLRRLSKLP